jgi:hypothetical protein
MSLRVEGLAMAHHGAEADSDPDAVIALLGRLPASHCTSWRTDGRKGHLGTGRRAAEVCARSKV